ncbi:nitronate monooxygenase [Magnetospirillum sp. 15-1]|uniref:NAD(P)H-dependent flavin oxidoreductase n=1 Tax=Magnetospirillum sp. 15-1 TaxID=1979370 RepID=UPI000BBC1D65|nr:nitronate monooxygenase [Magnetospirillum sp. 15-1]
MTPLFSTRITELFGIRLPVLAGGLQWLATPDYVAAAARAGICGFITAASYEELADLRAAIRRCRELAEGKPFGVNVSMLPKLVQGERTQAVFDLIVEEDVRFVETSGRNPAPYLPALEAAGIKVMHKVPAVKYAQKAQAEGVDAVAVVGAECGGHPGMDMVGTMVQANVAAAKLSIPLLVGGGIGTGAHLVAALALGADGVVVGTRFLVADEIWAHADYKRRLIEADETETTLILSSLRNTARVLRNEATATVQALESGGAGIEALMPHISGKVGREAYRTGDWTKAALSVGQSVAFADRIEPLAAIVTRFEDEARAALARLKGLAAP